MDNNLKTLQNSKPKVNKLILLSTGPYLVYGVKRGDGYFKLEPVRDSGCNCITHHKLTPVPPSLIKFWRYEDSETLKGIYEEYLS